MNIDETEAGSEVEEGEFTISNFEHMCPATYIISIHAAFNTLEKHSAPRCVSFLNDTLLFQKMRSFIIARSHYKNCVQ